MNRQLAIDVLRGSISADIIAAAEPRALVDFALRQGVAVLMRRELRARLDLETVAPVLASLLADAHARSLKRVMRQEEAIEGLRDALSVPYLVWRGLHLAKLLYEDPSERVGADIDLLVAPADRKRAIDALRAAGYSSSTNAATASHELSYTGNGVQLDLHWHMTRPQRARINLGAWLLTRGVLCNVTPVPDATATA
ncbi:MAG: nucleotidyltransferase family protein, partial [Clostridia bacterium]|nr:nucleotidyltransferase family protein [Deltaproteobacteria bacterium]